MHNSFMFVIVCLALWITVSNVLLCQPNIMPGLTFVRLVQIVPD